MVRRHVRVDALGAGRQHRHLLAVRGLAGVEGEAEVRDGRRLAVDLPVDDGLPQPGRGLVAAVHGRHGQPVHPDPAERRRRRRQLGQVQRQRLRHPGAVELEAHVRAGRVLGRGLHLHVHQQRVRARRHEAAVPVHGHEHAVSELAAAQAGLGGQQAVGRVRPARLERVHVELGQRAGAAPLTLGGRPRAQRPRHRHTHAGRHRSAGHHGQRAPRRHCDGVGQDGHGDGGVPEGPHQKKERQTQTNTIVTRAATPP